jgi:hypothetical protein
VPVGAAYGAGSVMDAQRPRSLLLEHPFFAELLVQPGSQVLGDLPPARVVRQPAEREAPWSRAAIT